jgi:hypothetical protein
MCNPAHLNPSTTLHTCTHLQEQRLLNILVNKLGDPQRKVASKSGYLLSRLLVTHPAMKGVVVREVERFVFRCVCGGGGGGIHTCVGNCAQLIVNVGPFANSRVYGGLLRYLCSTYTLAAPAGSSATHCPYPNPRCHASSPPPPVHLVPFSQAWACRPCTVLCRHLPQSDGPHAQKGGR